MKNTQFWPKNEEGAMFEASETACRWIFFHWFWYHWMRHVFKFPKVKKKSAPPLYIDIDKNAKNWKKHVFRNSFCAIVFYALNILQCFIHHWIRLKILRRMTYEMIYKTCFSKTFSYNNCEKLQLSVTHRYRNLEGYGNWNFFITLHELCVKKISSISEMVDQNCAKGSSTLTESLS